MKLVPRPFREPPVRILGASLPCIARLLALFVCLFVCLFDISLFSQVFDSPDENNSVHSPTRRYIVAANLVTLNTCMLVRILP